MKTTEINKRSHVQEILIKSNADAIEALVACCVCLVLVSVIGINNNIASTLYLIARTYSTVMLVSAGIRFSKRLVESTFEKIIIVFLIFVFSVESVYVIIDELFFIFSR